jgi:core-2/I-Branching enzyme
VSTLAADGDGAPRFAYLILTHKDPRQVEALAARILELSPHGQVVVHHDLASDEIPWGGRPPDRVHFVERGRVLWGDWSIVEATLRLVRYAVEQLDADWCVIVSGEHWPITDLRAWEDATTTSGIDAFVEAEPLPERLRYGRANEGVNMYLSRCVHRWRSVRQPRPMNAQRAVYALSKLSLYVTPIVTVEYSHRRKEWFFGRPRARSSMRDWVFYKGSQWIAFNSRAAERILHTDPAVTDWFRHGHIPDETYFHTVLRHADDLKVTADVVTYVPIGPVPPTERWMVLKLEDLPAVWVSGAAFARKVDLAGRPEVIEALNTEVDRRRRGGDGLARRGAPYEATADGQMSAPAPRSPADAPACVAVVGMHRSGTSATAGLLVGLGLAGPRREDLVPASDSNERGHWESEAAHMINVRVLAALGSDTYAPPPPASGWVNDHRFDPLRAEVARWFDVTSDGRPLVVKDPRLCFTLPVWRSAVPGRLATVFVLRDPLEVARSLQVRDELPIVLGLALWDRYTRAASVSLEGSPTLVVDYAAMIEDPAKWSDVVCSYLDGLGVDLGPDAKSAAMKFVDARLRHQRVDESEYEPLVGAHREVHAILSARAGIHGSWNPPELPPTPPWADYVLQLRREVVLAKHELYWTQSSRVFRAASALWRLTGGGPRRSVEEFEEQGGTPAS